MVFMPRDRPSRRRTIPLVDRAWSAALVALALFPGSSAAASPFSAPTPVAGFGDTPALAQVAGVALAPDGSSTVAGTADTRGWRQASRRPLLMKNNGNGAVR
jgi:hypothetical protein